jgi:hypothetical protein
LIIVLQYYLQRSQQDGGIIFALDINKLPLRRSFIYLYLPTVIAVAFSIFIVWIDNDAKRFEPYHQMSRTDGAFGKDSLLLHYPFDFMPFVPFVALKRRYTKSGLGSRIQRLTAIRHWLVFWASLATALTTFGIVPLQAGIFSTESATQSFQQNFLVSEKFVHSSAQESALTLRYAQTAYGVLALNETLPAYTTRNFTLKPFISEDHLGITNGTWTSNTTMYSLDLHCEDGQGTKKNSTSYPTSKIVEGFESPLGCFVEDDTLNNNTIGTDMNPGNNLDRKQRYRKYSSSFVGYYDGHAYYNGRDRWGTTLQYLCPSGAYNRTFYARFSQNLAADTDPPTNVTAIFCRPLYYEQDVEATVDATTKAPINVAPLGTKRPLPLSLFNATLFEETVAAGARQLQTRINNVPIVTQPRCIDSLRDAEVDPDGPPTMAMALMASKTHLQDLLTHNGLTDAYQLVYKILFAFAMTDVLATDFSSATTEIAGHRVHYVEAIVLEPVFTYLVEILLGIVSVAAIPLLYLGYTNSHKDKLTGDPGKASML